MPELAKDKIDIPIKKIEANVKLQIHNKKIELDNLYLEFINKIKNVKSEINE